MAIKICSGGLNLLNYVISDIDHNHLITSGLEFINLRIICRQILRFTITLIHNHEINISKKAAYKVVPSHLNLKICMFDSNCMNVVKIDLFFLRVPNSRFLFVLCNLLAFEKN